MRSDGPPSIPYATSGDVRLELELGGSQERRVRAALAVELVALLFALARILGAAMNARRRAVDPRPLRSAPVAQRCGPGVGAP
jgi:hypothetical protein